MRIAIVLALIVGCGPKPPAQREAQPPPPEPAAPLTPIPPPTDELSAQLPWDLYVMYRNVTEMAAAGTPGARDAALCDWNLQMMASITALYDHGDPGTVPEDEWRAALGGIDEGFGAMERACDEATDVEGRFGELRLDVEAGVRLLLATDSPTTP